ncbi:hypothetical protein LWP59_34645 [Amycolatopsis acidiphila]|uniref:AbiJ-NTD3 domain-containing protein n=1 Tax=Amycolatopsis acidiphila TaxID=715473 RepID=A0A557ZPI0_9PSEU|nr:hypothetical protein [Amycolatopsis acidiphila]TVT13936.1 hypothetical protein FNH06_38450 [Amycolatopsis acidiphila]UIJ59142.1 hypothetical protein LWP59_34645 [Amycolatopsis acidiphila]GHG99674.1 hypothetical protein GCM10017788_80250 [Amycolatopsis acidiphila]
MASAADLAKLREVLEFVPSRISGANTHATLTAACEALGLPAPPQANEGSKYERASASFAEVPDAALARVAEKVLEAGGLNAAERNIVQDTLWAMRGEPAIPKRTRREIARALHLDDLVHDGDRFTVLLDSLWVLDDDPFGAIFGGRRTLRDHIAQHVYRNSDWSAEELFERLGAFEASDKRFALFLEGLASADVVPEVEAQRRFVAAVNPHLDHVGVELRETGEDGGYPLFSLVSTRSSRGRPKNLIFASTTKPDIRFSDAIDNDIEIVGNTDSVLVYDRPIGSDGLRWRDLQAWWKDSRDLKTDADAKRTLYSRLQDCLPASSPPQRNLYRLYHSVFGADVPNLPALLPEVWLHWDPKTIQARGRDALLRFRMDFLLLLPHGHRVVLEVDGKRHYSTDGRADAALYATNMRADRDLKLGGYEVFRFGADELRTEEQARTTIHEFFRDLFRAFGVGTS